MSLQSWLQTMMIRPRSQRTVLPGNKSELVVEGENIQQTAKLAKAGTQILKPMPLNTKGKVSQWAEEEDCTASMIRTCMSCPGEDGKRPAAKLGMCGLSG